MKAVWLAAGLISLFGSAAAAEPTPPVRAEVPVQAVVLTDGVRRYAVPIQVGGTAILAGLDTGSTGLRILPDVLQPGDARPSGRSDTYSYGAGARFQGQVADAVVSVGALGGSTTVQLVERVGCTERQPHCAAGSIPVSQYGVQGDGLPGEGFKAILGVNMASADVASLFAGIGARRWIIDLPRPGEAAPGRIILNPTDAEASGFIELPIIERFAGQRGNAHDAVAGCLVEDAGGGRFCGAVILDTGAPGLTVAAPDGAGRPWPVGAPARLLFADGSGRVRLGEAIVIGRRDHATHMSVERRPEAPMTLIFTGLTPYFAYSVLYDPAHGTVGFKPRPPVDQGPRPIAGD